MKPRGESIMCLQVMEQIIFTYIWHLMKSNTDFSASFVNCFLIQHSIFLFPSFILLLSCRRLWRSLTSYKGCSHHEFSSCDVSHPQGRDCLPGRSHSVVWGAQVHNPEVSCYASLFIFKRFLGGSVVKNPPANSRDDPEMQSIPGLRRSPGGGNGNPFQYYLTWEIPWTEEPGGLQSMGLQRVGHDWATKQQQQ